VYTLASVALNFTQGSGASCIAFIALRALRITSITRGNKYKVINHRFHYDLRKHYFSARIVNIWNSLPNHVVDVTTVNLFKARLDRFRVNQDVVYDFTADLTGIGDRSVYEICEK